MEFENAKFGFGASIASTPLFHTLCTNDIIKTAKLTVRRASGDGKEAFYVQWLFKDARLVSYKMASEKEWMDDSIEIVYSGVEISYKQQKADGTAGANMAASYDLSTNTMVQPTLK